ncbi:hypothetical protein [Chitinimonas koreensis]|uniref:hypothetical protein n=1 Tax=Chitinimonas koreensis TaxID=356302 RepID=UPI000418D495|nr:hypothetical protein [Chitinimonas koreensis]QNM98719.1 hypothetical protein H9L41_11150 [Chitinimonas koreensis]
MRHSFTLLCAGLALAVLAPVSQAAECRATKAVVASTTSMDANKSAGGHVDIHITGQPTQVGKSRYTNWTQFQNLFTQWQGNDDGKSPAPKTCGGAGGSQTDCIAISRLGGWKGGAATVCTAVDGSGNCTASRNITVKAVAFGYYNNSKETKGLWIMNTSYPSENADCSQ